jgi:hypothetical protein
LNDKINYKKPKMIQLKEKKIEDVIGKKKLFDIVIKPDLAGYFQIFQPDSLPSLSLK